MSEITCYFRGCNEPGHSDGHLGIGALVMHDDKILFSVSEYIPAAPGNSSIMADYIALNKILTWLMSNSYEEAEIIVVGDSRMLIHQMEGNWKINKGHYVKHATDAKNKLLLFKEVVFRLVDHEFNEAYKLSEAPLIAAGIQITKSKVR